MTEDSHKIMFLNLDGRTRLKCNSSCLLPSSKTYNVKPTRTYLLIKTTTVGYFIMQSLLILLWNIKICSMFVSFHCIPSQRNKRRWTNRIIMTSMKVIRWTFFVFFFNFRIVYEFSDRACQKTSIHWSTNFTIVVHNSYQIYYFFFQSVKNHYHYYWGSSVRRFRKASNFLKMSGMMKRCLRRRESRVRRPWGDGEQNGPVDSLGSITWPRPCRERVGGLRAVRCNSKRARTRTSPRSPRPRCAVCCSPRTTTRSPTFFISMTPTTAPTNRLPHSTSDTRHSYIPRSTRASGSVLSWSGDGAASRRGSRGSYAPRR